MSTYYWSQKRKGRNPEVTWKIKAKCGVYTAGAKFCDVCLTEKTYIMLADKSEYLNVRTEILNKCRHRKKFTLEEI